MKKTILYLMLVAMMAVPSSFAADSTSVNLKPKTTQEWQKYLRYRREETLEKLYAAKPEAKYVIEKAQGYAVFSNFGMKLGFFGGGSDRGILYDNKSGKETFMRMINFFEHDFRTIRHVRMEFSC